MFNMIMLIIFLGVPSLSGFQSTGSSNKLTSHKWFYSGEPSALLKLYAMRPVEKRSSTGSSGDVEDVISTYQWLNTNLTAVEKVKTSDKLEFPEVTQSAVDEKALRNTPFG